MMYLKKLLACILAGSIALAFTACGSKSAPSASSLADEPAITAVSLAGAYTLDDGSIMTLEQSASDGQTGYFTIDPAQAEASVLPAGSGEAEITGDSFHLTYDGDDDLESRTIDGTLTRTDDGFLFHICGADGCAHDGSFHCTVAGCRDTAPHHHAHCRQEQPCREERCEDEHCEPEEHCAPEGHRGGRGCRRNHCG